MVNTARGTLADLLVLASKRERSSICENSRVRRRHLLFVLGVLLLPRVLSLLVGQV